jgi:hypothetical protein
MFVRSIFTRLTMGNDITPYIIDELVLAWRGLPLLSPGSFGPYAAKSPRNVLGALWLTPWHFTSGFWDATCEQRWEWSGAIPRPRHCDKLTSDYE